jgi:hypothetical protein
MNKKTITLIFLGALIAITTFIGYKSLENLDQLDFNDPFEVELDDE